ncbi:O-antigen ligase family protein [Pseudoalteromonas sp. SSDWG2]|uniref:O-antigen ligase family protein n=1 Tax=Pseudoalteromonas sp. SSDWG2 TaxID=3139391 RepID=UPI003BADAC6D
MGVETVYDTYRWLEVLVIALALIFFKLPSKHKVQNLFFALCFFSILSLIFSPHEYRLHCAFATTLTLGLYLLAMLSSDSHKWLSNIVVYPTLLYSQLVVSVVVIVGLTALTLEGKFIIDPYSYFDNVRYLNHMQVLCFPLLLSYLITTPQKIVKLVWLLIFLNFAVVAYSGARGAMLAFFVSLLIFYVHDKKVSMRCLVLLISTVLFSIVATDESLRTIARTTSSGRLTLWLSTLQHFELKHLFIGTSPGLFDSRIANTALNHPHNAVLQLTYGYGFIFAAIAIFTYLYPIKLSIKEIKNDIKCNVLVNILVSAGVLSLVSGVFINPLAQLFLAVTWGALYSKVCSKDTVNILEIRVSFIKLLFALVLVITCWLSFDMMQKNATGIIRPGLWLDLNIHE